MFWKLFLAYGVYSLFVHFWAKQEVELIRNRETVQHRKYFSKWNEFFYNTPAFNKTYVRKHTYLHRNWIDHEEQRLFCCERFTLQRFLLAQEGRGSIDILSNNSVILNDNFKQFGIIPLRIFCYGILNNRTIYWNRTEFVTPFKRIENPKIAMELSQYPWTIRFSHPQCLIVKKEIPNMDRQLIYGSIEHFGPHLHNPFRWARLPRLSKLNYCI